MKYLYITLFTILVWFLILILIPKHDWVYVNDFEPVNTTSMFSENVETNSEVIADKEEVIETPNIIDCWEWVERELANKFKSPSTVKFIECNINRYNERIFWEADAQNSFWAILRYNFICRDKWSNCHITEL